MKNIILILVGLLITTLSYASNNSRTGIVSQGWSIQFGDPRINVDTSQVITCHFPKNLQLADGALTMNFSSSDFAQTQNVTMSYTYSKNLNQLTFRPYLYLTDRSKTSTLINLAGSASNSFRVESSNQKIKATQTTIICEFTKAS